MIYLFCIKLFKNNQNPLLDYRAPLPNIIEIRNGCFCETKAKTKLTDSINRYCSVFSAFKKKYKTEEEEATICLPCIQLDCLKKA